MQLLYSTALADWTAFFDYWEVIDHDKTKQECLSSGIRVSTIVWLHHMDFNKTLEEKVRRELHEFCMLLSTNLDSSTPQNSSCAATYFPSYKLSKTGKNMLGTAEVRTEPFSDILQWTPTHRHTSVERPAEATFISSMRTLCTI